MKKKGVFKRCLASRPFVFAILLLLIVMGPIMIAIDLTFLQEWIEGLQMIDLYVYLGFMGLVSIWSAYGFLTALMRSSGGFTAYMVGLFAIVILQFIVGIVHIMLLFITYQPIMMNNCLQRHPSRLFWWSLGFEDTEETKQVLRGCQSTWSSIATERIVSWIVYTVVALICLFFVVQYQRLLLYQHKQAKGLIASNQTGDWSDDDDDMMDEKKKGRVSSVTYHDVEFPSNESTTNNGLTANMYQQRQRLFDEIAKRKRARENLDRKPAASNSNRNSAMVVHPLDLSQDPGSYQPLSSPPPEQGNDEDSWNRYHKVVNTLKEEEEAIERQKKLNALSAERMEYEMYRSDEHSSSGNPNHYVKEQADDEEDEYHDSVAEPSPLAGTSHRKRPKTGHWSTVYGDNNILKPMTSINQQKEEDDEDDENQKLMNPSM